MQRLYSGLTQLGRATKSMLQQMKGAQDAATKTHDAVQMKGTKMTKRQPFENLVHLACASFCSDSCYGSKKQPVCLP